MTPAGIKPVTFRFVTQHLNHRTIAVPDTEIVILITIKETQQRVIYIYTHTHTHKIGDKIFVNKRIIRPNTFKR